MDADQLRTVLRSSDTDVVFKALVDVLMFGPMSGGRFAVLLPEVVRLATDPTAAPGVRGMAVMNLPLLGPADEGARGAALAALADPEASVRRGALQALIPMRNLRAEDLERIRQMAADSNPDVARWSEIALQNIARLEKSRAEPGPAPDTDRI